ncbi:MAG: 16S rRNA (uracil(1498)-N(3))-methyltransferase [Bacteroidetes bacterium]|nr:16S rRNA (uracil(1498)-N(3))-methyltransferase [Bacteroidota bacterium]MBS1758434.1 16S rRNA (uracil(1498)-N(3))-methyltransferase [Bacteroidota bacterium]
MSLPIFYYHQPVENLHQIELDETASKHIVQVLRMQQGEQLQLTDGRGNMHLAEIAGSNRKRCPVKILETVKHSKPAREVTIAISLIKNNSRFEWFLEKATEIGVTAIIPIISERTEKQHFRIERMQAILVSAMLQSKQTWLPALAEPVKYLQLINTAIDAKKMIAYCEETENRKSIITEAPLPGHKLVLIGPEGDFTPGEIQTALANNFIPVSLGHTRLRTETAGIVAASLLCNL